MKNGLTHEGARSHPRLFPWHGKVLSLLIKCQAATAEEIGERLYPMTTPSERAGVALHELRELARHGFVDRDYGTPERWYPGLFAGQALRFVR